MQNGNKIAVFRPENVLKKTKEIADRYGFDFFGFPLFELVVRKDALAEIEAVFGECVDIAVFTRINGVKKAFGICNGKFDWGKSHFTARVPRFFIRIYSGFAPPLAR